MNKRTMDSATRRVAKVRGVRPQDVRPYEDEPKRLKCDLIQTNDDGLFLIFTCKRCGQSAPVPGDVDPPVRNCHATLDQQRVYDSMQTR